MSGELVLSEAEIQNEIEEAQMQAILLDSQADLEDKIVPKDGDVEVEEFQLSDDVFEDIYQPKKTVEIEPGDLDGVSNFLDILGEDVMESDILEFL